MNLVVTIATIVDLEDVVDMVNVSFTEAELQEIYEAIHERIDRNEPKNNTKREAMSSALFKIEKRIFRYKR